MNLPTVLYFVTRIEPNMIKDTSMLYIYFVRVSTQLNLTEHNLLLKVAR